MNRDTSNSSAIESDASTMGSEDVDTNPVIRDIAIDMLLTMHNNGNSKLDAKIEKVYSEWNNGAAWEDSKEQVATVLLVGHAQQDKTTFFKEAAKLVSSALDMEFLEKNNLDSVDRIDPEKHFVFVSLDQLSMIDGRSPLESTSDNAAEWYLKQTGAHNFYDESRENLKRLLQSSSPKTRLMKASQASGSCVLFTDFLNSPNYIQEMSLNAAAEKRINNLILPKSYIGLTGDSSDLGATHIPLGVRHRCRVISVDEDKLSLVGMISDPMVKESSDIEKLSDKLKNRRASGNENSSHISKPPIASR